MEYELEKSEGSDAVEEEAALRHAMPNTPSQLHRAVNKKKDPKSLEKDTKSSTLGGQCVTQCE